MGNVSYRTARGALLAGTATVLVACAAPGPSIKQRADEATERRKANKASEDFAKTLPPTDSKPIFKP